jgi:hypothetical protein
MKKIIIKSIFSIILLFVLANFCYAAPSGAQTINIPNPIQSTSTIDLINTIANYLLWIAVIGAPLVLIIAALMFMTAGGSEQKVTTAKKMFLWAVIGLSIALISKGIISLIKDFLGSAT